MNDFIREIQEDIERQKWASLWQRYGNVFVALIVAIVLGAAGWQAFKYMQRSDNIEQTSHLLNAVKDSSMESLQKTEQKADGVQQAFAMLIQAQLLENQGDSKAAQEKLHALATSSNSSMPADLAKALTGMARTNDAFPLTATERAGWKALEEEKYDKAAQFFEKIVQSEEEIPASIYDRAKAGLAFANLHINGGE